MNLAKNRGQDLRLEEKESLKEKYSCLKDSSNTVLHVHLTEAFGPIDKLDRATLLKPLPEEASTKVERKGKAKASSGFPAEKPSQNNAIVTLSINNVDMGPDANYLKDH